MSMQDGGTMQNRGGGFLPWIVGGCLAGGALLLCGGMGSPLQSLHRLSALAILPPVWMVSLAWLGWLFALGVITARMLCDPKGGAWAEAGIWRGSTFLTLSLALCIAWYALLVPCFSPVASWICLLLSAAAMLICLLSWWSVSRGAAVVSAGYALWLLGATILQLIVMLRL